MLDAVSHLSGMRLVVRRKEMTLSESFASAAGRFAPDKGTVVLLSGGGLDSARYNMLAVRPWLILKGSGEAMVLEERGETHAFVSDPFDALRSIQRQFGMPEGEWGPVAAGLFGYLSYDLKDAIEKLPRTTLDRRGLPQIWFSAPSALLVEDRQQGCTTLFSAGSDDKEAVENEAFFLQKMSEPVPTPGAYGGDGQGFVSNFDKPGYMETIERIKEYIRAGDIYQVNMSQRFEGAFSGDPYALFLSLFEDNPAPFFAFVQAGDHQVVSTSPERFIRLDGKRVETRPIKGTRPRGKEDSEDLFLKHDLETSYKDDAELSMIVDLMRNDIGRVCRAGSVHVSEHKRVEAYKNVFHLVSVVTGELDETADAVDLLRATFPGGSITGCPKIRSMEIIDELETDRRHIYTGSIGYLSFHGTMDLSIAIRTATVAGGRAFFSVGGGVVYDSDPADEYEETLDKSATLMRALSGKPLARKKEPKVWFNGRIMPASSAGIPVMSRAAQYGAGLFETLRVERGEAPLLEAHIERLTRSWGELFEENLPDISWKVVIRQLLEANGIGEELCALKIMAFQQKESRKGHFSGHLALSVRPYIPRLSKDSETGLRLVTEASQGRGKLGRYKSLNYLFCLEAMARARSLGAHDALLLNADGSVSELATANLLVIKGKEVLIPVSDQALPGVMAQVVGPLLASWGYRVSKARISPADLYEADGVIATNALMGALPVAELDGVSMKLASGVCEEIRKELLRRA
ncbi:MAG: aminodeoxychorismate synthase component I [Desulfobacterales bacterium]|nr:aminodeoxychorismate synthase component I [Desulfobacterales bacterium]